MAHLQDILIRLEPVLLFLVVVCFFKSGSWKKFPALATYFVIRGVSVLFLEAILWKQELPVYTSVRYEIYFYSYWVSYVACAVALFFVVQEVFKRVMEPVPGLRRLGLITFRWISIVSAVVAIGAIALPASAAATSGNRMGPIAMQMMRCLSVMELCLLAFLALSIHALGRTFRSRLFGIGLGFGLQAAMELILSAFQTSNSPLVSSVNFTSQLVTTLVLLTWAVYFLVPEPVEERKLIVLPPTSVMARWNALANGLGQTPEPMVAQPTGFFLQDIEGVVDRVLAKNPVIVNR